MIPAGVSISYHAWRQFIIRRIIKFGGLPACPMAELRRLMSRAQREDLGGGAVKRLLDNNFEPAAYFIFDCWRFVLTEDLQRVMTIEIATMRNPHVLRRKRRQRR